MARGIIVEAYGERFKSKFEKEVADQLLEAEEDLVWSYEGVRIPYNYGITGSCADCGSTNLHVPRNYFPDFIILGRSGTFCCLEVKGHFKREDRKKALEVRESFPWIDLRFVFKRDNKMSRRPNAMTYSRWCEINNFEFAVEELHDNWFGDAYDWGL